MGNSVGRMLAVSLIISFLLCSCSAFNLKKRTIKVEGMSSVEVDSDVAVVCITVREDGDSSKDAQQAGNARINSVVSAAKGCGISPDSIKTTAFRIYPIYDFSSEGGRKHKGQEYFHSLEVEIKDCKRGDGVNVLAGFIDSLNDIDKVEICKIVYRLSDNLKWISQVRTQAVENGMEKCRDYAKGAGMKVGSISSIFENYFTLAYSDDELIAGEMPFGMEQAGFEGAALGDYSEPMQAQGGKVSIKASVSIEVELE
ncbi:MAG TPA: hypothetical protein DCO86_00270 [Spirochaetaceae bacterium]|nr:hypothetical protein [Spirochaetaceae bacterium]